MLEQESLFCDDRKVLLFYCKGNSSSDAVISVNNEARARDSTEY